MLFDDLNIIVKMKFGAHLYGTATPDSDVDYRGVFLPSKEQVLLGRQIKDAKLFEQTRIASWGKLSTAALIDIARVYLESGDVQTAYSWLNKIPEDETYQAYERDQLLLEIYRQLGDDEKLTELLYRKFRSHHSTETLEELLDVIYLKKLDKLAVLITKWNHFDNHEAFKAQIFQTHGRKRSFWSKYEVKK